MSAAWLIPAALSFLQMGLHLDAVKIPSVTCTVRGGTGIRAGKGPVAIILWAPFRRPPTRAPAGRRRRLLPTGIVGASTRRATVLGHRNRDSPRTLRPDLARVEMAASNLRMNQIAFLCPAA